MSDSNKKSHTKFRTFASDLNAERTKQDLPTKKDKPAPAVQKSEPTTSLTKKDEVVIKKKEHQKPAQLNTKVSDTKTSPAIPEENTVVNKIPAFHELTKSTKTKKEPVIKVSHKTKSKHFSKKHTRPKTNIGYDATVISDTKSNRFKLFPAIVASFQEWLKLKKKKKKIASVPKYTVTKTEHRKGVIQKATSKSGAIFTADNETIKEQIRRRQKREQHTSESSWSPYTETGFNLIEAPARGVDNVKVEFKKTSSQNFISSTKEDVIIPVVAQTKTEPDSDDLRWANSHNEPEELVPTQPILPLTEVIEPVHVEPEADLITEPAPAPAVEVEEDILQKETKEEEPDALQKTEPAEHHKDNAKQEETAPAAILNTPTNTLVFYSLLVLVLVITAVVTGKFIYGKISDDKKQNVEQTQFSSLTHSPKIIPIPLSRSNTNELARSITETISSNDSGLTEMILTYPAGREIAPALTLNILGVHTILNFNQTIQSVRLASFNKSAPVLLLQSSDRETAYGGLLSWEPTMTSELATVFGNTVSYSGNFIDETISEHDIRALYNNEIFIIGYTITDTNLIIISKDKNALSQILEFGFSE